MKCNKIPYDNCFLNICTNVPFASSLGTCASLVGKQSRFASLFAMRYWWIFDVNWSIWKFVFTHYFHSSFNKKERKEKSLEIWTSEKSAFEIVWHPIHNWEKRNSGDVNNSNRAFTVWLRTVQYSTLRLALLGNHRYLPANTRKWTHTDTHTCKYKYYQISMGQN